MAHEQGVDLDAKLLERDRLRDINKKDFRKKLEEKIFRKAFPDEVLTDKKK